MMLFFLDSMVNWDEKVIIHNESAGDQWLPESCDWFGEVVKFEVATYIKLI